MDPKTASAPVEQTILREQLALDRTTLANERTFLAYIRTGLTLLVVGLSFVKLPVFHSPWFTIQGWAFLPLGLLTFAVGTVRFLRVRRDIHDIRQQWSVPV